MKWKANIDGLRNEPFLHLLNFMFSHRISRFLSSKKRFWSVAENEKDSTELALLLTLPLNLRLSGRFDLFANAFYRMI